MNLAANLRELSSALRSVGNKYFDAALNRGEKIFKVRVWMGEFTREQGEEIFANLKRNERVDIARLPTDPQLQEDKEFILEAEVRNLNNPSAALIEVLEALRTAIREAGLCESRVTAYVS